MREKDLMEKELIITGASTSYAPLLLSLIGSAKVNWPGHPRLLVYDLGLDKETLNILDKAQIEVRPVPPFCDHWRRHFTWKIWCCHDAPTENYLWLDAGVCILRPFPEAFVCLEKLGYYCQVNGLTLNQSVCRALADRYSGCRFESMLSINAGIHGLNKQQGELLLSEAIEVCREEIYMKADHRLGRHDQDLLSILFYKYFSPLVFSDRQLYSEHTGPDRSLQQRVWHCRHGLQPTDMTYFVRSILAGGEPRIPLPSKPTADSWIKKIRISVAKLRGRYPVDPNAIYDGVRD
jgi:hypothetical protein